MTLLEELSPSKKPLPEYTAHALQAAYKIEDAILSYQKVMERAGVNIVSGVSVPFATLPIAVYVRVAREKLERLPAPKIPAANLLDRASDNRECCELLAMGIRYAMGTALPVQAKRLMPLSSGQTFREGIRPVRIISPKFTWDVDEGYFDGTFQQRAMMALVGLALSPVEEINHLIESIDAKGQHVWLGVDPLKIVVKREAYIIEVFSYCHVFGGNQVWKEGRGKNVAAMADLHDGKMISCQTSLRSVGIDFEEEQRRLLAEAQYIEALQPPRVIG